MTELIEPWRTALRTVHIAISVAVVGADVSLIALGIAGLAGDPATLYPAAQLIGARVVWPLALGALASGLALALLTPYGVLRYWWVTIKLAVTASLSALVLFVLLPAFGAAADAAIAGEAVADSRRLLLVAGPGAASAFLVLNVVLAVFKPGGRIGGHRRRTLRQRVGEGA